MADTPSGGSATLSPGEKRKADAVDASESTRSGGPRKVVELHPQADVLLRVGKDDDEKAVDIKVSSHIMSAGSEVFERMLNGHFLESITKVVYLDEEEDPDVFLDYCKLLHNKFGTHKQRVEIEWFFKLAKIADMRGSAAMLRPWILWNLNDAIHMYRRDFEGPTKDSNSSLAGIPYMVPQDMLQVAATFLLHFFFWLGTKTWILNYTPGDMRGRVVTPCSTAAAGVDASRLLGKVIASIFRRTHTDRKATITAKSTDYLSNILSEVHACIAKGFEEEGEQAGLNPSLKCQRSQALWAHYSFLLLCEGIGTVNGKSYQKCVRVALASVIKVTEVKGCPTIGHVKYGRGVSCSVDNCGYCNRDIRKELKQLVKKYSENVPGICLECYRTGSEDYWCDQPCTKHAKLLMPYA